MKIVLSISMILFVSYMAAVEAQRCGRQGGGSYCKDYACCSQYGYCGTTGQYCLPKYRCQSNCWTGPSAPNVTAYHYPYDGIKNNFDLHKVKTACSDLLADRSDAYRRKYGWAAFCGPVGPRGLEACGQCIRVQNRVAGGQIVKLRIVDVCVNGGLKVDEYIFDRLDVNGVGRRNGYLKVFYQFIDCEGARLSTNHTDGDFKSILASVTDSV